MNHFNNFKKVDMDVTVHILILSVLSVHDFSWNNHFDLQLPWG